MMLEPNWSGYDSIVIDIKRFSAVNQTIGWVVMNDQLCLFIC